jgi:hypothetical protein
VEVCGTSRSSPSPSVGRPSPPPPPLPLCTVLFVIDVCFVFHNKASLHGRRSQPAEELAVCIFFHGHAARLLFVVHY